MSDDEAFSFTGADQRKGVRPLPTFPLDLLRDLDTGSRRVAVRVGERQEGRGPRPWLTGEKLWDV